MLQKFTVCLLSLLLLTAAASASALTERDYRTLSIQGVSYVLGVSTCSPMNAKFTAPEGTTLGRSETSRTMKYEVT